MLPSEFLQSLNNAVASRELQIQSLSALLSSVSPSTLVLHGAEATGKTLTVKAVLQSLHTPSTTIQSKECITTRYMLERTLASVQTALERDVSSTVISGDGKCESISVFVFQLQRLLEGRERFILVFDGIDCQREAEPTLLPAIARLGELVNFPTSYVSNEN